MLTTQRRRSHGGAAVAFTDFTFDDLRSKLGLKLEEDRSLYADVPELAPSPLLAETLADGVPRVGVEEA